MQMDGQTSQESFGNFNFIINMWSIHINVIIIIIYLTLKIQNFISITQQNNGNLVKKKSSKIFTFLSPLN